MIQQLLNLVLVTALLTSCGSTRVVTQASQKAYFDEINARGVDKKTHILLHDGQEFDAFNIRVAADSTSWQHRQSTNGQALPTAERVTVTTSEVGEIAFKNRGKGARHGFLIAGAIPVALFSLWDPYSKQCEQAECSTQDDILGGLAVFVGSGVVFGLPIGASIGARDKYILSQSATEK